MANHAANAIPLIVSVDFSKYMSFNSTLKLLRRAILSKMYVLSYESSILIEVWVNTKSTMGG